MQIRIPLQLWRSLHRKLEAIYPQRKKPAPYCLFLEPIVTRPELMLNDGIHPTAKSSAADPRYDGTLFQTTNQPAEKDPVGDN